MEYIVTEHENTWKWTIQEWIRTSSKRKSQEQISVLPEFRLALSFSTYFPSKVTLKDPRLIPNCWTMYQLRANGVSTFTTLVVPYLCTIIHSRLIAGRKDAKEGRQTVFFTALDSTGDAQEEEYQDVSKPRSERKSKWKSDPRC